MRSLAFARVAVRCVTAPATRTAPRVDRADGPIAPRSAATLVAAVGLLVSACATPERAAIGPAATRPAPNIVLVGGPCEGCEAVFDRRPATLGASAEIAGLDEPGERLVITGAVKDGRGRPA